jgi:hypothetical protein
VPTAERDEPGRQFPGPGLADPEPGVHESGPAVDPDRHAALHQDVGHGVVEHERRELLELQRVRAAAEPDGQRRPRQERWSVGAVTVHGGTLGGAEAIATDHAAVCGGPLTVLATRRFVPRSVSTYPGARHDAQMFQWGPRRPGHHRPEDIVPPMYHRSVSGGVCVDMYRSVHRSASVRGSACADRPEQAPDRVECVREREEAAPVGGNRCRQDTGGLGGIRSDAAGNESGKHHCTPRRAVRGNPCRTSGACPPTAYDRPRHERPSPARRTAAGTAHASQHDRGRNRPSQPCAALQNRPLHDAPPPPAER